MSKQSRRKPVPPAPAGCPDGKVPPIPPVIATDFSGGTPPPNPPKFDE